MAAFRCRLAGSAAGARDPWGAASAPSPLPRPRGVLAEMCGSARTTHIPPLHCEGTEKLSLLFIPPPAFFFSIIIAKQEQMSVSL